ncbi:MAG: hypothetical protein IIX03_00360, partial [Paludibacteraceae bacterium]|nr:hypothetical protein [Paludibacteraceae bacterium]
DRSRHRDRPARSVIMRLCRELPCGMNRARGAHEIGVTRNESNQLTYYHAIEYAQKGDFVVDSKYTFEVGGASKDGKQIAGEANAYIAADNIEYALGNKIPLWLFGFLY